MSIAGGIVKVIVVPVGYAASGPYIGTCRGMAGHKTPLDYEMLMKTYPSAGRLKREGKNPYFWPIEGDVSADLGSLGAIVFGTLTSALPWLATRTARTLAYEIPLEAYRTGRKILGPGF